MKYFILLSCLLISSTLEAEEPFWEYIGGPPTGTVENMKINSKGDVFITARSGVFKSTDRGENWKRVFEYYSYSLAITSDDIIFITGAGPGNTYNDRVLLYKSTDDGQTWDSINGLWSNKYTSYNKDQFLVGVDKDDAVYLVAGDATDSAFFYYSSDKGSNWKKQYKFGRHGNYTIKLFPEKDGRVILTYVREASDSVYSFNISKDYGKTWKEIRYKDLLILDLCYGANDTIMLTGFQIRNKKYGFGFTTDEGETFTFLGDTLIQPLKILDIDSENLYLGSSWGLYYSSDRGKSWRHNLLNDFDSLNEERWRRHELDNPNSMYHIISDKQGRLYTTAWMQGVYISDDKGLNWTRSNKGFTSGPLEDMCFDRKGNLYACYPGLYKSTDKGKTWETLGFLSNSIATVVIDNDGTIYAGSAQGTGLFRSSDGGMTWDTLMFLWDNRSPQLEQILISSNGNIIAEDGFDGFYISTDKGETWIERNQPGEEIIVENSEGHIFVGDKYCSIWRTTNLGQTWDSVIYPSSTWIKKVESLIFKPNSTVGYAITEYYWADIYNHLTTLWRTTDNGRTWEVLKKGSDLKNYSDIEFVIDSTGRIWDGFSLMNEDNFTWQKFSSGYKHDYPKEVEVSPDGFIFIGDYWGGIYKSRDSFVSSEEKLVATEIYLAVDPNPFETSTNITWNLLEPAYVSISMYDILGREIYRKPLEYEESGNHSFNFNSEKLQSGVYYLVLEAGNKTLTRKMQIIK